MSLVITPNFDKKTAKYTGTVAAGEHASITIKNAAQYVSSSLRLRVAYFKKTLAVFPYVTAAMAEADNSLTADTWTVVGNDITCTLNLNTVQALKLFKRIPEMEVLFVFDDTSAHLLYFKEPIAVKGWPQDTGDTPIDLGNYVDTIAAIKSRLDSAEADIASNASAISEEAAARANADTSQASELSAMASTLANKQDAGDYVQEADLENLATKEELESGLAEKQDAGNYLTEHQSLDGLAVKSEVDAELLDRPTRSEVESGFATKEALASEANTRASKDAAHDVQDAQHSAAIAENAESAEYAETLTQTHMADNVRHVTATERATWDTVLNKADKSTTYTKAEVDTIVDALKNGRFITVQELPDPEEAETKSIYLVPREESETGNVYDEYIVVLDEWEKIGSTDIDLSGYYTATQTDTLLAGKVGELSGNVNLKKEDDVYALLKTVAEQMGLTVVEE